MKEKELIRSALELKAPCPDELTAADILSSGSDKAMLKRRFPWLSVAVAAVLMISAAGLYFYKHSDNRIPTDNVSEADDPGTVPSVQPVSNDEVIIWTDTDQTDKADDSFDVERVCGDYSDYVFHIAKNRFYCMQYTFTKDVPTNTYVLIDGERIRKVYLKDVSGDGKKEIFVETCPREGYDDTRIAVFNMADKTMLNMYIEGVYTASMSIENGSLLISDKTSVGNSRSGRYEAASFDYSETYYGYIRECVKQGFDRMRADAENTFIHAEVDMTGMTGSEDISDSSDLSVYYSKLIQRTTCCLTNESAMKVFDIITDEKFIDSMNVNMSPEEFVPGGGISGVYYDGEITESDDAVHVSSGDDCFEYSECLSDGRKVLHVHLNVNSEGSENYTLYSGDAPAVSAVRELAAMLSDPVSTSLSRITHGSGNLTAYVRRLEDTRSYVSPDGKIHFAYTFETDEDYIYIKILGADAVNGAEVTDGGLEVLLENNVGNRTIEEGDDFFSGLTALTFDELKDAVGSSIRICRLSDAYNGIDITFRINTEEHPQAVTSYMGIKDYSLYGYAYSEQMYFG